MNLPSSILESGYIICEYNSSEKEIPAEDTVDNQAILLQKGNSLIIYNKQMKVERVLTGYDNIYSFDATFQIYAFPTRRFELSLYFSKNLT